jgi:APA family basic amino acid/polyamine antiporter
LSSSNTDEGLKKVIGVPALTLTILGGVIGAGIYALPAVVSVSLGAFGIFAYIVCGIMLASIMLCYAEAGCRVSKSGGSYVYVENAFGKFSGYIINWLYTFGWGVIGSAALMNILADSLAVLFPIFANGWMRAALFFFIIAAIMLVNIISSKHTVGFVKLITIIKLIPLAGIIIFGFSHIQSANLKWQQLPELKTFSNTVLVLFFAFAGFETSMCAGGEIKNPKRTVPLSICLGGFIILVIYLLLQTVAQGVLGEQMSQYKEAPLAAVAEKIIGSAGATVLLIAAAVSCFGNTLLDIFCSPRTLFAGANDGLYPKFFGRIHKKFNTPYTAILTYGTLIFILSVSGGFRQLAILASACILIIYLAVLLSVVKLRLRNKEANKNSFKAPGGWITPIVGIASIIWLLTSLGKWEILSTVIFMGAVSLIYIFSNTLIIKTKPDVKKV